jgi:hypothetical protein
MSRLDSECMTHKIMQGEIELIRGDELSIRVIFGNLTGRNWDDCRPPWRNGTHADYLAFMERELSCRIRPEELVVWPVD